MLFVKVGVGGVCGGTNLDYSDRFIGLAGGQMNWTIFFLGVCILAVFFVYGILGWIYWKISQRANRAAPDGPKMKGEIENEADSER